MLTRPRARPVLVCALLGALTVLGCGSVASKHGGAGGSGGAGAGGNGTGAGGASGSGGSGAVDGGGSGGSGGAGAGGVPGSACVLGTSKVGNCVVQ
jgi:hypothetical protein